MPPTLRWARSSKMRKKDDTFGYEGKDLEQRNKPRSYQLRAKKSNPAKETPVANQAEDFDPKASKPWIT